MNKSSRMARYTETPPKSGFWFYDDLRIQADVETHQFVVDYTRRQLPTGVDVLDIACGEGALACQLLDIGCSVTCTSWNDKYRIQAPVYQVDLDHPFGPNQVGARTYPLVAAVEIIEHLESPLRFLRSLAAVLAPTGVVILSTPNIESAAARLQWLIRGYPSIFSGLEVTQNRHVSMLWGQGLEFLIEMAGLRVCEKHLLGRFRVRPGLVGRGKRLMYWVMGQVLPGDVLGTTRLYVLERAETQRASGPEEVF